MWDFTFKCLYSASSLDFRVSYFFLPFFFLKTSSQREYKSYPIIHYMLFLGGCWQIYICRSHSLSYVIHISGHPFSNANIGLGRYNRDWWKDTRCINNNEILCRIAFSCYWRNVNYRRQKTPMNSKREI